MIVSTWNDGSFNPTGAGYGVKISKEDRKEYFNKEWKSVLINIDNTGNRIEIPIHDTFWTTCSELRNKKIGEYLIDNNLNKWDKRKPHKLILLPENDNVFTLTVIK